MISLSFLILILLFTHFCLSLLFPYLQIKWKIPTTNKYKKLTKDNNIKTENIDSDIWG